MKMKADPKASELKSAKKAASLWISRTAGKKEALDPRRPSVTNEVSLSSTIFTIAKATFIIYVTKFIFSSQFIY